MARKAKKNNNTKLWLALFTLCIILLYSFGKDIERQDEEKATTEVANTESTKKEKQQDIPAAEAGKGIEIPVSPKGLEEQLITRLAYSLSYNKDLRLPNWVAWHLTADHVQGTHNRKGLKFAEDETVPTPRATNLDYVQSGYDRGHMCPSGDNKWSEQAQLESFIYTNCCPQLHNLNAGDWEELESRCREWASEYGDLYIVCGPLLLNKKHKTIGKNKVVVPEAFFKVVLRLGDNPAAIGFVYRNEVANKPITSYVNTVDDIERLTGIDFFPALDDKIENKVEAKASISDWE